MIVYHGTVDAYLPSIEKEGLKVVPKTRFYAVAPRLFHDLPLHLEDGIYLSTNEHMAEMFALLRASWLSVPIGKGLSTNMNEETMIKTKGDVLPDAKPIVLKLDLPESLASTLNPDTESEGNWAYWTVATIPPACIKSVITPKQEVEYYASA